MIQKRLPSQLLDIQIVAEMLGVHKETLRRWDKQGILKAIRINKRGDRRYEYDDVIAYKERMKNK